MFNNVRALFVNQINEIKESGLYKTERIIESPQSSKIKVGGTEVINFCANNYLGLSNSSDLKEAAKEGIDNFGLGLSSVRFICGTQTIHKKLEKAVSEFLSTEDTILYSSCFDANGGLFETLLGENDAIVSDSLNHASIIDGIRLCKANRYRYEHNNLNQLEEYLKEARAKNCPKIMIATDGIFSMDGDVAPLPEIVALAEKYEAILMVDDSHATGFFGKTGRGSIEHHNVMDKVDIVTSTLGKALGGSAGGFTTGKKEMIEVLRQRSRPYLFSNSLPPALVSATIKALQLIDTKLELLEKLRKNTAKFREEMTALGFNIRPGIHPICPVMLGDAKLATLVADDMLKHGIYVIGFSFPVVPKGQARIRVQISAGHSEDQVDKAIDAFRQVGKKHGVI